MARRLYGQAGAARSECRAKPMNTVHDIAALIIAEQGELSAMKLQKLVYYSQAWSLAKLDRPLFDEDIEAWANGPVVPELFNGHRGRFMVSTWLEGDAALVPPASRKLIREVLGAYASLTARELSDRTHREGPWLSARGSIATGAWSNAVITQASLRSFYAGREMAQ